MSKKFLTAMALVAASVWQAAAFAQVGAGCNSLVVSASMPVNISI